MRPVEFFPKKSTYISIKKFSFLILLFSFFSITCGVVSLPVVTPLGTRTASFETGNIYSLTWSPDGKTIAASLIFFPGDSNPIWYEDGKVPAAFSEILLINVESGELSSFYKEENTLFYASNWSPDSKKIIVVRESSTFTDLGGKGIWIFDVEENLQPEYIGEGKNAAWSPNGDMLAIINTHKDQYNSWIWEMMLHDFSLKTYTPVNIDLSRFKEVGPYNTLGSYFSWSSDGKDIFFEISTPGKDFSSSNILSYNFEGKTISNQWDDIPRNAKSVMLSPSQKEVSYKSREDKTDAYGLVIYTLGNHCYWTFPEENVYTYTWSPDSRKIAYEDSNTIWVVDLKEIFGDGFEQTNNCP